MDGGLLPVVLRPLLTAFCHPVMLSVLGGRVFGESFVGHVMACGIWHVAFGMWHVACGHVECLSHDLCATSTFADPVHASMYTRAFFLVMDVFAGPDVRDGKGHGKLSPARLVLLGASPDVPRPRLYR